MNASIIIFSLIMFGFFIGCIVGIPIKVYLITSYERAALRVTHDEYIFLSKRRAIQKYKELREKAIKDYTKIYPNDFTVPEDFDRDEGKQLSAENDNGIVMKRFRITNPYKDYDTKELDITLRNKYMS